MAAKPKTAVAEPTYNKVDVMTFVALRTNRYFVGAIPPASIDHAKQLYPDLFDQHHLPELSDNNIN